MLKFRKNEIDRVHYCFSVQQTFYTCTYCKIVIMIDYSPLKGGCQSQGTRTQGIYEDELRALRRETLLWINLLYRSSTPLSRSPILPSSACNCSSSHTALLLCNVLETRDHLGISICFNKTEDVDSSREMVISLASAISITTLESFLSEAVFLLIFLNCFCAFLASRVYALT
uniref:Predicted protein n=1 Tax=Hordeum vulgare subsp. vulgare TaxID=112509 RepID=F2EDX7_HORVV|nr:predicted protein [Hordeum vulgare subsp. vulgare]